jgi:N-acetylneuraminic acid mutarotase
VDEAPALTCVRHGRSTRITCVTCDTPICPDCAIRTQVGFKCPDHATKSAAATPKPKWFGAVVVIVGVAAIMGFMQLARSTGRGDPVTPPCPTETAPDVGIGPAGGGERWKDIANAGLCGRYDAAVAWTGSELLVWGGENCAGGACPSFRSPHMADGGAYKPAGDSWRKLARSPLAARSPAATAWTGTEMLVWGGVSAEAFYNDGAAYDPARDTWRPVSPSPLSARNGVASAWTGQELLVWGGGDLDEGFADGAAYDPATDRWRTIAEGPIPRRAAPVAVWTGREMVIWGGADPALGVDHADGAAYDPATNGWRTIAPSPLTGRNDPAAVWTGRELVVWSGATLDNRTLFADGAAYDPATDRWRTLPPAPLSARTATGAVWSGRELLVWGGIGLPEADGGPLDRVLERRTALAPLETGAAYDPATDRWRPLEPVPLLGRAYPITAWDGEGMIVWGGLVVVSSPASASDGVRYRP